MSDDDEEFDDEVDAEFDEDDEELPNPYAIPEVEALLDEAIEMLAESRPLPMSNTVKVNRDELLHLLEQIQDQLPEEVRAARWLLKEREEFIAKARREHQALIDEGRAQVSRMVERQQVVKEAEARARKILDDAQREATTMKRQVEEYCDRKLARFETVLTHTTEVVQRGRQKLLGLSDAAGNRAADFAGDDGWAPNGNGHHDIDVRTPAAELEGDRS